MYRINLSLNIFASSFLIFYLGTTIGSFLNVLIDRIPKNQSFIKGRSYCDYCKKKLQWFDLIPLLSFILLKRKCRYCGKKISFYYPIVELTTGILFTLTFLLLPKECSKHFISLSYYLLVISALIVVFFADIKYGIIPDKVIYTLIVITFLYLILNTNYLLLTYVLSAFGAFFFFLLIFFITKGKGMGFGDVKLSFLVGLILGFPKIIAALYMAFLTGAIVSLILIICRKKKFFGGKIPFGPFLVIGTIVGMFWGEKIIKIIFAGFL